MNFRLLVLFLLLGTPVFAQQPPAPSPSASPSAGNATRREETVDVEAELPAVPPSASAATRVPVPVESLPATISVVPRSVFRERGGFVLSEALKSASGVNTAPAFGVFDYFVVRGFDSLSSGLVVVDGAPEPEATFYPLYNVRQIEVLKGPGAFLYGGNPLAAAVQVVRKQPALLRFAEASLAYGRFGTYEAAGDGNLANEDGSLAFRLGAVSQGTDGYRDRTEGSLRAVHPAFSWRPDPRSRVTASVEYVRSEASPDTGIPFVGAALATVPRTTSYQSPYDASVQDVYRFRLDAERQLASRFTLRNKLYYTDLAWDSQGTLILGAFPIPQGPLVVGRVLGLLDDRQKLLGNQLEAAVRFNTGSAEHSLLAGVEAYRLTDVFTQDVAFIPAITLENPTEAGAFPIVPEAALGQRGDARSLIVAPYVLDRMTFSDRFSAMVGARLDKLDFQDESAGSDRSATRVSPLAGVVFSPRERLSVYVSGTTAFAPPSSQVVGPRDPERSRQLEVGVKATFLGGKGYGAFNVYHLERDNIPIPDSTGLTRQTGDQRSRGFELDFSAELGPRWQTYASYAFTDATLSSFAELVQLQEPPFFAVLDRSGNTPPFAPRHLATVWTSRTFDRLTVGAGARYVTDQFIGEDNRFEIDRYLTIDAAAAWKVGRSRLSFNVRNLTGAEYETRGFGSASAVPGRPFEILGRVEVAVGGR